MYNFPAKYSTVVLQVKVTTLKCKQVIFYSTGNTRFLERNVHVLEQKPRRGMMCLIFKCLIYTPSLSPPSIFLCMKLKCWYKRLSNTRTSYLVILLLEAGSCRTSDCSGEANYW